MSEEQEYQEEVQEVTTDDVVEETEEREELPEGFIDKERWVEMGRDPDEWRDPDEFKERGEKIQSVLKQQRDELKAEIDSMKQDFVQYRQTREEAEKKREKEAYERAKAEYDQHLKNIRKAKAEAVENMDGERFTQLEDMQDQLKPPQPPPEVPPQQQPQVHPDFVAFMNKPENAWYSKDSELRDYADFIGEKYVPEVKSGNLSVAEALDKVSQQVRKQFSHKFGNPRRETPATVDGGGGRAPKKGKDYRDLPSDAKAACDRFVKRGVMTKEQYVKDYFGE